MHYSAKHGVETHVVGLSVSLCVTLVDHDHIWLKILETNCTDTYPNTVALRSPKTIHLLPWEHRKIWGKLEMGRESGMLEQYRHYL